MIWWAADHERPKQRESSTALAHRISQERRQNEMADTVRDPVCGMMIDPNTAAGKSEYRGRTYYFCSPGCKQTFDAQPEKYADQQTGNVNRT
jgi:Cu+-exporting ATPase